MRRATLGMVSPAQLNSRISMGNGGARNGTKMARTQSLLGPKQQQAPGGAAPRGSGRPSLSRRSSSMYGKSNQTQVETRPIGDRAFQQDCIRSIVNYLIIHGYKNPVSQKVLQMPSSKDAVSIVQFLILQVDQNWEFKKTEEDVPLFFKRLGYPVQISRSALYAAGSPVSWPSLLAALSWLTNLLMTMEPSQGGGQGSPFDTQRSNLFTEYINTCYHHFLKGEDDECQALDEGYAKNVKEENEKFVGELEKYQAESNEAQERVRKLRSEPSPLAALEAQQSDYKDDIGKFNMVISNFLSHKEAVEKKREEKRQELATKKEEAINMTKENEVLRERIAAQQINAADIDKMLKEKEILQVNLQSVSGRKQELEKTAWDHEINSSKKLRDLETVASQFNESCERLGLSYKEESQGHYQIELKLQPWADTPGDMLGGNVKTVIKPALIEIMEKSKKVLTEEINPEALNLQEQLFKREISAREKLSQIANAAVLNKTLDKKLEAQYKARDGTMDVTANSAELEAKLIKEERTLRSEDEEVEQELREREARFEATVKVCNEEIKSEGKTGEQILDIILSTKERTQLNFKRVEDAAAQSIEVFRDLLSTA
ncbi:unnamed protein product [Calypogeia fissa]